MIIISRREYIVVGNWNVFREFYGRGGIWVDIERDLGILELVWVGY